MKKISLTILSSLLITTASFSATLGNKVTNNSLIVYNGNIGLVHEERTLKVDKNDKEIIYRGVANMIDTDSVNVELPKSVTLYSQQYRFDRLTQRKLLEAHINKQVIIKQLKDAKNFQKTKAKLLSANSAYCIVQTNKGDILSVPSQNIILKQIPKELITKPSLVWNIKTTKSLKSKMKIDYLIKNINWRSNYILNIKQNKANLVGFITVNNRSGKNFKNTKLYVLAGDINQQQRPRTLYKAVKSMRYNNVPKVKERSYEGYHFYTIPSHVNIANNEKTQIKFIDKTDIPIQREYIARLNNPNYFNGESKQNATQFIYIKNLDIVLPKGVVRTYSKLKNTNILLGETNINHTPKNSPIKLKIGKNFDIQVTQSIVKRDDTKIYRDATIRYSVKNSSESSKNIQLLIPFNKNSNSTIDTQKTYIFTKGNLVTFNLKVGANSTKSFNARFRTKVR